MERQGPAAPRYLDSTTLSCHDWRVPTYTLADLAKLADVTPRTVRYYITQGLLPSPDAQGPQTRYTDEHLERLLAIKRLQAQDIPLAKIRARLRTTAPDDMSTIASSPTPTAPAPAVAESALDYIRDVLGDAPIAHRRAARAAGSMPAAAPLPAAAPPTAAAPAASPPPPGDERSQWERITLDPDVELHVRRPLSRQQNKRVERLIRIVRELFKED